MFLSVGFFGKQGSLAAVQLAHWTPAKKTPAAEEIGPHSFLFSISSSMAIAGAAGALAGASVLSAILLVGRQPANFELRKFQSTFDKPPHLLRRSSGLLPGVVLQADILIHRRKPLKHISKLTSNLRSAFRTSKEGSNLRRTFDDHIEPSKSHFEPSNTFELLASATHTLCK